MDVQYVHFMYSVYILTFIEPQGALNEAPPSAIASGHTLKSVQGWCVYVHVNRMRTTMYQQSRFRV